MSTYEVHPRHVPGQSLEESREKVLARGKAFPRCEDMVIDDEEEGRHGRIVIVASLSAAVSMVGCIGIALACRWVAATRGMPTLSHSPTFNWGVAAASLGIVLQAVLVLVCRGRAMGRSVRLVQVAALSLSALSILLGLYGLAILEQSKSMA